MENRYRSGWLAVVMIWLMVLVVLLFYFQGPRQEPDQGTYVQQSAQPAIPINVHQVKDRIGLSRDTSRLLLYPNPVRNTLHVVVPRGSEPYLWLGIYRMNGELVKQYTIESGRVIQVDVQVLPVGDYVVKIADRQSHSWTAKFMKT